MRRRKMSGFEKSMLVEIIPPVRPSATACSLFQRSFAVKRVCPPGERMSTEGTNGFPGFVWGRAFSHLSTHGIV